MYGERKRILAIFAHPDDETFLAGGTLAKYAAAGHEVFLLCATHGESGRRGEYEPLSREEFAALRQREMEAAARALGVHPPMFLECADRGLARECWNSATEEIVRIIRRLRPDVMITFGPDGVSGHVDHIALSQIVTAAFWAASVSSYLAEVSAHLPPFQPARLYYVLRSGAAPQCCQPQTPLEAPEQTTAIDIGEHGMRKLQAIRCYRSQEHLQPGEPTTVEAILKSPEHYHRAVPPWEGAEIETELFRSDWRGEHSGQEAETDRPLHVY